MPQSESETQSLRTRALAAVQPFLRKIMDAADDTAMLVDLDLAMS